MYSGALCLSFLYENDQTALVAIVKSSLFNLKSYLRKDKGCENSKGLSYSRYCGSVLIYTVF